MKLKHIKSLILTHLASKAKISIFIYLTPKHYFFYFIVLWISLLEFSASMPVALLWSKANDNS